MKRVFETCGVGLPEILLPKAGVDMQKWAVVACDQYTSDRQYWKSVDEFVGDEPSTLRITLPEVYLEDEDVSLRIELIRETMNGYMAKGHLQRLAPGFIYVERQIGNTLRRGLVMAVDLERYDYNKGSTSLIRATEGTIIERLPPRIRIREGAPLELPHIMLLIDDAQKQVIEPLATQKAQFEKVYDFDLMQQGGRVQGYHVTDEKSLSAIAQGLQSLNNAEQFAARYGQDNVLLFAVGDGNHSLATAKACWERLKPTLTLEQQKDHPARYALVELVNVHDEALVFEPIHRVLFGVDTASCADALLAIAQSMGLSAGIDEKMTGQGHEIPLLYGEKRLVLRAKNPVSNLPVGTLQSILDVFIKQSGCGIDYIHGEDVVERLSQEKGNLGFLLPAMDKNDLFKTVVLDGALPRKTFSMGEAHEKRYYLEARQIVKE